MAPESPTAVAGSQKETDREERHARAETIGGRLGPRSRLELAKHSFELHSSREHTGRIGAESPQRERERGERGKEREVERGRER